MTADDIAGSSRRSRSRSSGAVCFEYERDEDERTRVTVRQDIDPSFNDAIDVAEPDARTYADRLPADPLPGSGDRLNDCGEDVPGLFCSGCGTPYYVGRTCRRSRCPRCWNSWAFHRAKAVASKLEALGRHEYTQNGRKVKQHHLTVSPRDSTRFNSKDPIGRAAEAVKVLLAKANVQTGYIVYHPYRIRDEYRGEVAGHDSGSGDMTWKDVLHKVESEAWSWDAVRDEFLIYSPHFHVLCISEFVETGAVVGSIEAETGVVIHRITKREKGKESISIEDTEDLCKVTAYALSHAGLARDEANESYRAAVRPFGKVANFEAWGTVEQEVTETLRTVAPTVLGLECPDPECTEHVERDDDREQIPDGLPLAVRRNASGPGSGSGDGASSSTSLPKAERTALPSASVEAWKAANDAFYNDDQGSWETSAGHVPRSVVEPSGQSTEKCGEQLVPIWTADTYLADLEWLAAVERHYGEERIRELRSAVDEWHGLGRPHPDTPPPD